MNRPVFTKAKRNEHKKVESEIFLITIALSMKSRMHNKDSMNLSLEILNSDMKKYRCIIIFWYLIWMEFLGVRLTVGGVDPLPKIRLGNVRNVEFGM